MEVDETFKEVFAKVNEGKKPQFEEEGDQIEELKEDKLKEKEKLKSKVDENSEK